jgi:hypothetical protein
VQVREARRELMKAGLVAYRSPLYQVLSLEPPAPGEAAAGQPRTGQARSIGEILQAMIKEGGR